MIIKLKGIDEENFNNYKKTSMILAFPNCSFKCEKECGEQVCQNSTLVTAKSYDFDIDYIVDKYMSNNISQSIVCAGLEPFDNWKDLLLLINAFRLQTDDDIVIYTGYKKEEILSKIKALKAFPNIIIKFGRFIPNQKKHYDEVLGVELASDNQYAERIS